MSEIRVNNVIADNGLDAVNFSKGINVSSGIITATSFNGNVNTDRIIPTGGVPSGGAGGVIQVKQTVFTGVDDATGGINTNLTDFESNSGLICTLTPTRSDSKILVEMALSISLSVDNNIVMTRIRRKIGGGSFSDLSGALGDAASSRYRCTACIVGRINQYSLNNMHMKYLDSPATTSAVSYSFSAAHDSGSSRTIYINRGSNDTSSYAYVPRATSTITLTELSG